MKWKFWYSDWRTFSNEDGPPRAVPSRDVQVVVQEDPFVGRVLLTKDYYIWREDWGQWIGTDLAGMIDLFETMGILKVGRMMPNKAFHDLVVVATNDPYLPVKSGVLAMEK